MTMDDLNSQNVASVIISSRESLEVLQRAVISACLASEKIESGWLDVVVNGNPALAEAAQHWLTGASGAIASPRVRVRLWHLPLGDKAHAWNSYTHFIWPGAATTVFVDGYVRMGPEALRQLDGALCRTEGILAATGVPTVGWSAKSLAREMVRSGGIHGNLCALNRCTMDHIRTVGFRLPLGLYRVDGLLGAAVCFQFDPENHAWNSASIRVLPSVTWAFDPLRWWKFQDILRHRKRVVRQRQGVLENLAVRHFLRDKRIAPQHLPDRALELIEAWIQSDPESKNILGSNRALQSALVRLRVTRDWSDVATAPQLMFDGGLERDQCAEVTLVSREDLATDQ